VKKSRTQGKNPYEINGRGGLAGSLEENPVPPSKRKRVCGGKGNLKKKGKKVPAYSQKATSNSLKKKKKGQEGDK